MKVTVSENENKPSIDWSKPQLVISNNGRLIQTTGLHEDEVFAGLQLVDWDGRSNVGYSSSWDKSQFTPFNYPITLQND